jgi:hypothetical protein
VYGYRVADRGIVDKAIWTKPCGDLAGQLLYGDSLQCSNFELDIDTELNGTSRLRPWGSCALCNCPAKSYYASRYQ